MSSDRLRVLEEMLARNPGDTFARYGMAMERRNTGDLEGALVEFRALLSVDPDYIPAYQHGGQTLERLGRLEEAREMYAAGIEVAKRRNNPHAAAEMQAAVELMG